jgi:hypothetical protein
MHYLMLTGEAALPMYSNIYIFTVILHVDHDLFHQVPDNFLAILVSRADGVPQRGEIGGECLDARPFLR